MDCITSTKFCIIIENNKYLVIIRLKCIGIIVYVLQTINGNCSNNQIINNVMNVDNEMRRYTI